MLTRLAAILALCLSSAVSFAQLTDDYPPDYCFGCGGDEDHPSGYDGYPGDHPDNPFAPSGGPGGDGWGSGDGGKGGDGVSGGDGGRGGASGPDGGCGGAGGDGGDAAFGGHAGNGGQGGDGVDCGGAGGDGGDAMNGTGGDGGRGGNASGEDGAAGNGGNGGDGHFGGGGGCGGNATGGGGQGGGGGHGGDATGPENGAAGAGGCGGNASGDGGCGGDGGNGGNSIHVPGEGITGIPGFPGPGGTGDDGCNGNLGQPGDILEPNVQALMPTQAWGFTGFTLAAIEDDEFDESTIYLLSSWLDMPGIEIGWADFAPIMSYPVPDANGLYLWQGALHKDSLGAERIRVEIEARDAGPDPFIDADFGFDPLVVTKPSGQKDLGDGWYLQTFTVIRPVDGQPIGPKYDVFTYLARDVEVRLFRIIDLGPVGDVTLDQQVNTADLALVGEQVSASGDLEVEDGDTNMDGVVDTHDVITVIQGIGSP